MQLIQNTYTVDSLSKTDKGQRNMFETERVQDKEKLVKFRKTEWEKREKWFYDKQVSCNC